MVNQISLTYYILQYLMRILSSTSGYLSVHLIQEYFKSETGFNPE